MYNIYQKGHRAISDMEEVHVRLQSKVLLQYKSEQDIKQAQVMEKYLRSIKSAASTLKKGHTNIIASTLDDLAYEDLINITNEALNIMNANRGEKNKLLSAGGLFSREHSRKDSIKTNLEVDDVFEEELYAVLKAVETKATHSSNIDLGISLTGGQMTNIRTFAGKLQDEIDVYLQEIFTELVASPGWTKKAAEAEIAKIKAVSGKVDLKGYNSEIVFSAELDPKWENMVKAFAGASFTLKNYTSRAQIMELHLGNSSPYRAMIATLDDLGFDEKEANHIYYHSRNSWNKNKTPILATHIYHTRLYYELTGVGLYDKNGDPISSANFIIYNDPYSENIYVRSTKKIIYDLIANDKDFVGNPYQAVTLKKTYFI